ncbi:MAG: hypothetical protein CSA15_03185 [Candidatus Delongbacteria bacterium]|nr:MAG: hypothetical protein CSA15_03185 [Candidatus Delongbacteria bacterium]
MKIRTITLFLLFILTLSYGEGRIKVTAKYGSINPEIQNLYDFENIFVEQLNFEGSDLKGSSYIIDVVEFKDGEKVSSNTLFDGTELDYFKINSNKSSLIFNIKLEKEDLKVQLSTDRFRSKKLYYKLSQNRDRYVLKDFFGNRSKIYLNKDEKFPILAIITPTINKNGSASYCNVVQSEVKPDKLGISFKIPHYFLVYIEFK